MVYVHALSSARWHTQLHLWALTRSHICERWHTVTFVSVFSSSLQISILPKSSLYNQHHQNITNSSFWGPSISLAVYDGEVEEVGTGVVMVMVRVVRMEGMKRRSMMLLNRMRMIEVGVVVVGMMRLIAHGWRWRRKEKVRRWHRRRRMSQSSMRWWRQKWGIMEMMGGQQELLLLLLLPMRWWGFSLQGPGGRRRVLRHSNNNIIAVVVVVAANDLPVRRRWWEEEVLLLLLLVVVMVVGVAGCSAQVPHRLLPPAPRGRSGGRRRWRWRHCRRVGRGLRSWFHAAVHWRSCNRRRNQSINSFSLTFCVGCQPANFMQSFAQGILMLCCTEEKAKVW